MTLGGRIVIDQLLLELMREVAVLATVGMLAEFPLDLICGCGLETGLEASIDEIAEEELLLRWSNYSLGESIWRSGEHSCSF